jgi:hypothetical protein
MYGKLRGPETGFGCAVKSEFDLSVELLEILN